MAYNSTVEEFDILGRLQTPHLIFYPLNFSSKIKTAAIVLMNEAEKILLINSPGFCEDSILAGITEKHIEYIAKNAPKDYKENILKLLQNQEMVNGVFEIAKAMDEDLGKGAMQNQERVRNVIQYIKDNRVTFEF